MADSDESGNGRAAAIAAGGADAPRGNGGGPGHAEQPMLFTRPSNLASMRPPPLPPEGRTPPPVPAGPQLNELIDFSVFNDIFNNFLAVTGLPIAIIDLHGQVLASSRWQHLCMDFHRVHERTLAGCLTSDTQLARQLSSGQDWAIHRCANGLTDCATPIVVDGCHVANLFTGQFLLEAPDMEFFAGQQSACGFDRGPYFKALSEIPIIAAERIPPVLNLLRGLAQQIAQLSLGQHRVLSVLADVERQVSERTEKLAESEDRFRALFSDSPLGQLLVDPETQQIVECNQAAADILGYRREELETLRVTDCDVALSRDELHALRTRLLGGEVVHFETRIQRQDGTRRDLEVTVGTLQSRRGMHFHVTHLDITARKVAEQEQRRLTRALRLLSDCNQAMIRAWNERQLLGECCRLIVESGSHLVMGWVGQPEADAGRSVRPLARFGHEIGYLDQITTSWDEDSPDGRGPTGTAIRSGRTQVCQNLLADTAMAPWQQAACRCGYLASIALPIFADGVVIGVLCLYSGNADAFDTDEVALLEEVAGNLAYGVKALRGRVELERHRQQLENRVAERTREIAALNAELKVRAAEAEAANRTKSDFLATMSHELRTPLNAVVGFAGLLADSRLDRSQRDFAGKILSSAQTLRALIDDILDLSKIEAGALQLEQTPFSLSTILRTTASVISIGSRGKPVEPLLDVAADIPDALLGDALRLQQILLNLSSNAVKYTDTGVIVVSVRCLEQQAGTATLQFTVRDTGIGILPEHQTRIFEVFTQADSSTSRRYGGTGLGLPISARLAALMGGTITVDSAVRWGSEFTLTVPLALAEEQPPASADSVPGGLRLLIVDDQPMTREVLASLCQRFGWQASTIGSSAEALAELRRSMAEGRDYDMMLLDWRMPGLDGIAMLRQAYAAPDIALPLVVLMAATFELEQAAAASDDLPVDGILTKPVTPESLLEAVQRAYTGTPSDYSPLAHRSDRRLAGLRLLVVEDNELNRQVIEGILVRAGASVLLRSDGRAAIEALAGQPAAFDAVLMDIQMPVMDGYEATRIIRQELGLHELPIIAVTAHARPEDRDRSRQAGMLGHLVKPIDVEDLLDLIAGHCPAAPRGMQPATDTALPDIDQSAVLATFGADLGGYLGLLRQFVELHGADAAKAAALLDAGDRSGAARVVHELRGIAGFLQAREVARLAGIVEQSLDTSGGDQKTLLAQLQQAMDSLVASLPLLQASPAHQGERHA
ncbi:MAG: response regulator [Dechloromonas sp.]|nr:response regulator [Dechloromonas sp.]